MDVWAGVSKERLTVLIKVDPKRCQVSKRSLPWAHLIGQSLCIKNLLFALPNHFCICTLGALYLELKWVDTTAPSIRLNHSFEFCQLADLRASLCFIKNTNTNIDAHTITSLCAYQAYPKVSVGYCREEENTRQTIKRVQWGGDTVCMEIEIKIQVQIRVVIV